mmetsp:Transcript_41851/g.94554  ORF Transcript_41851/g.94554 Transcript_41851/m.94554 type:complete len:218 (-) Transcript_41851:1022-1675(-)
MKSCIRWWAWSSMSLSTFPRVRSKQLSKGSDEANTSGFKKFSMAQSSWRLFCMGVPVRRTRWVARIFRHASLMSVASFLILWPSSRIKVRHHCRVRQCRIVDPTAMSYVVTTTSNDPTSTSTSLRSLARSASSPEWSRMTRSWGQNLRNSMTQAVSTDRGTITRWGPDGSSQLGRCSVTCARKEIVCSVFPRPISSARMQLTPWSKQLAKKLSPSSW